LNAHVRIGDKGLVRIPAHIRQTLGVRPGDTLLFEVKGQEVSVRSAQASRDFAKYRGIGNLGMANGRKQILKWNREVRGR
jgi:AbrB family looped-hinge helix DNA binding protein